MLQKGQFILLKPTFIPFQSLPVTVYMTNHYNLTFSSLYFLKVMIFVVVSDVQVCNDMGSAFLELLMISLFNVWGFINTKGYKLKIYSCQHLKQHITTAVALILSNLLELIFKTTVEQFSLCLDMEGQPVVTLTCHVYIVSEIDVYRFDME